LHQNRSRSCSRARPVCLAKIFFPRDRNTHPLSLPRVIGVRWSAGGGGAVTPRPPAGPSPEWSRPGRSRTGKRDSSRPRISPLEWAQKTGCRRKYLVHVVSLVWESHWKEGFEQPALCQGGPRPGGEQQLCPGADCRGGWPWRNANLPALLVTTPWLRNPRGTGPRFSGLLVKQRCHCKSCFGAGSSPAAMGEPRFCRRARVADHRRGKRPAG